MMFYLSGKDHGMEANTERERDNGRQEKYRVIKVWGTVKKQGFREGLILLALCVPFFNTALTQEQINFKSGLFFLAQATVSGVLSAITSRIGIF